MIGPESCGGEIDERCNADGENAKQTDRYHREFNRSRHNRLDKEKCLSVVWHNLNRFHGKLVSIDLMPEVVFYGNSEAEVLFAEMKSLLTGIAQRFGRVEGSDAVEVGDDAFGDLI